MIIEVIQQIKEKLEVSFPKFKTDDYPDDFSTYRFNSPYGCALVRYDGSSYGSPYTVNAVVQNETLEFTLILGFRYVKAYRECYDILEKVKDALTGLVVMHEKLYPKKRQFIKKINGDYWWGYTFNIANTTAQKEYIPNVIRPIWDTAKRV